MSLSVIYDVAQTTQDLEQILSLQQQNHFENTEKGRQEPDGFVTVTHSLELLTAMNLAQPQPVAKVNDKIIGYALIMLVEFQDRIPTLAPLFNLLKHLTYKQLPLSSYRYYIMGQICIAPTYRGQGVFTGLYAQHQVLYAPNFDLCITEVSTSNHRSMKAHTKVGFERIYTYRDEIDEWNLLVWDLK